LLLAQPQSALETIKDARFRIWSRAFFLWLEAGGPFVQMLAGVAQRAFPNPGPTLVAIHDSSVSYDVSTSTQ